MKSGESNPAQNLSEAICRAVVALKDTALRIAHLRDQILHTEPQRLAAILNDLCSRAEQADPTAREVLAAALPVLADPDIAPYVDELRGIAARQALLPLGRFFRKRRAKPHAQPHELKDPALAAPPGSRSLTLGERRALARKPSRSAFDKLLHDPHPLVIKSLLENPRLTEDDVVRLACFRPAKPDVILEIARSSKWSLRPRVRMAIVMNPGSPPEVSVPMVGLLIRPELEEVASSPSIGPLVRGAALDLLARRPPLPDEEDPELQ